MTEVKPNTEKDKINNAARSLQRRNGPPSILIKHTFFISPKATVFNLSTSVYCVHHLVIYRDSLGLLTARNTTVLQLQMYKLFWPAKPQHGSVPKYLQGLI